MVKTKKVTQKQIKRLEKKERNRKDKEWREALKKEFDSKCIICDRTEFVHAHHLFPREIKPFRHEVLNGVLLCAKHHKYSYECSPHKNPIIFINFYKLRYKDRYSNLLKLYYKYTGTRKI
jgi:hypothetical protein